MKIIEKVWGRDRLGGWTPYMTRLVLRRFRIHIFHRGDGDPDPHDHPWDFWTFPLTSYVETTWDTDTANYRINLVRAWRLHWRPSSYVHCVLGRRDNRAPFLTIREGKIITIVWARPKSHSWGFWKMCGTYMKFIPWKDYVEGRRPPCK